MSDERTEPPRPRRAWGNESDVVAELHQADDALTRMLEGLESRSLTPKELEAVRELILADRRTVWLWSTIKVWATWIAAVMVGVTMGWDGLKKIIAALKS